MRIEIDDDRCEGHGLCEARAPQVFVLDADAAVTLRVDGEVPVALRELAADAAGLCPVAALRVIG